MDGRSSTTSAREGSHLDPRPPLRHRGVRGDPVVVNAAGCGDLRLDDHVRLPFESARIFGFEIPFSPTAISEEIEATVRANRIAACYVRLPVYLGSVERN